MLVIKSKKNYTICFCELTHNLFIIKDLQKRKTPRFWGVLFRFRLLN